MPLPLDPLLQKSVFEGIAQEAVATCKGALEKVSKLIEEKHVCLLRIIEKGSWRY